jgi:hypothetical protein
MADKNIDYKNYVSQFKDCMELDPVECIKKYLEELSQDDEALKSLYRPEKIDDCYNFIKEAVRTMASKSGCYCVEDAVVFKMARDYYIDILPKVADEPPEVRQAEKTESKESEETEAETPPEETTGVDIENSGSSNPRESDDEEEENAMPKEAVQGGGKTDEYGFEVFGETEEAADTCGAEETEAETPSEETSGVDIENSGSSNPRESGPEVEAGLSVKYDENGNGLLFEF